MRVGIHNHGLYLLGAIAVRVYSGSWNGYINLKFAVSTFGAAPVAAPVTGESVK
jgi:hypothetical protein